MSDASILIDDMQSWSTDELISLWAMSDDDTERYAASHVVRHRAADYIDLMESLQEYGGEHPDKIKQL